MYAGVLTGCWCKEDMVVDFSCMGLMTWYKSQLGENADSKQNDSEDQTTKSDVAGAASKASDDASVPPHVQCLDCFRNYGEMSIRERKLCLDKITRAYTVACPCKYSTTQKIQTRPITC